jgi:hypothetical protein
VTYKELLAATVAPKRSHFLGTRRLLSAPPLLYRNRRSSRVYFSHADLAHTQELHDLGSDAGYYCILDLACIVNLCTEGSLMKLIEVSKAFATSDTPDKSVTVSWFRILARLCPLRPSFRRGL